MNDKEINKFIKDIIGPAFGFEFINNFASEKSRKSNETKDCAQCLHFIVSWNGCTPDYNCKISDKCKNGNMWERKE